MYLNDKLILTKKIKKDIGRIAGIRYQFIGYGEVDYVKYSQLDKKVVFQEDFQKRQKKSELEQCVQHTLDYEL